MPYIKQELRDKVDSQIRNLVRTILSDNDLNNNLDGVANYVTTRILMMLFKPVPSNKWKYASFCRVTGCLTNILQEIYRRAIGPHEDKVIAENGDIQEFKEF